MKPVLIPVVTPVPAPAPDGVSFILPVREIPSPKPGQGIMFPIREPVPSLPIRH